MRRTLRLKTLVLAVITPVIALSTAGFAYTAYVRLYATVLNGFDRKLAALSSTASVYIDVDETLALLGQKQAILARGEDPEQHPTYLAYVVPMREILRRAGLTFLYTQALNPGRERQCVYLLDATVGEGHSALGDIDTIPDQDWDVALRVVHDGVVAQTGIREWEQWGLLKCGWAPMYGKDGRIKAMAGADVEITIIRQKTYAALLRALGAGVFALAVAGFVSVRVARRITQPLGEVREAALRIASGNYGLRCQVESPREMRALAHTLNELTRMMETVIGDARPRLQAWRRHRAAEVLLDVLTTPSHRAPELAIAVLPGPHASGYAIEGHLALVWCGVAQPDDLSARRSARDVQHVAQLMLRRHGAEAVDRLGAIFGARMTACALIDTRDWGLRRRGADLEAVVFGSPAAPGTAVREASTGIAVGQLVVLAPAGTGGRVSTMTPGSAPAALDAVVAAVGAIRGVVAVVHRQAGGPAEETG
jgi:hypothetical protein